MSSPGAIKWFPPRKCQQTPGFLCKAHTSFYLSTKVTKWEHVHGWVLPVTGLEKGILEHKWKPKEPNWDVRGGGNLPTHSLA